MQADVADPAPPAPARTGLRRDAQARRERLIEAAVRLYSERGFDVPLERIAEEAGVTRPTLYRNFPDRDSLTAMVMKVHLHRLKERIAGWADRDDAFLLAIKAMAVRAIRAGGTTKITRFRESGPIADQFHAEVDRLLAAPLERAKAGGLIRDDFTVEDANRVILMVAGGGLDSRADDEDAAATVDHALALLMAGLAPRPAAPRG